MERIKNLVVGAGLSGATLARKLAECGQSVLVIDRREHIAGNIYDRKISGITVHGYGPHVFHTNDKEVWDFLSRFTDWHLFMYRVKAFIDGQEVPVPFNLNSLHALFPAGVAARLEEKLVSAFGLNVKVPVLKLRENRDEDLGFLADYVYRKVFLGYTVKQWGVKPEELDPSVSGRVPVYISRDDRYFQDKYQAIPADGYTKMTERMLQHPNISVKLNTPFDAEKHAGYDRIFYTGPVDEYFNYELGELPYRSLDISFCTYKRPYFQSGPQINYPENYDFTRAVEYKYYLNETSENTVVSFEYPRAFERGVNERYYPVPAADSQALYARYAQKAAALKNVYFLGRLGDYKYYNMDQAVARALKLAGEIK